jgi:hypothetical protein
LVQLLLRLLPDRRPAARLGAAVRLRGGRQDDPPGRCAALVPRDRERREALCRYAVSPAVRRGATRGWSNCRTAGSVTRGSDAIATARRRW